MQLAAPGQVRFTGCSFFGNTAAPPDQFIYSRLTSGGAGTVFTRCAFYRHFGEVQGVVHFDQCTFSDTNTTDVFVSPRGSDLNPGTLQLPVATLQAAIALFPAGTRFGPSGVAAVLLLPGAHNATADDNLKITLPIRTPRTQLLIQAVDSQGRPATTGVTVLLPEPGHGPYRFQFLQQDVTLAGIRFQGLAEGPRAMLFAGKAIRCRARITDCSFACPSGSVSATDCDLRVERSRFQGSQQEILVLGVELTVVDSRFVGSACAIHTAFAIATSEASKVTVLRSKFTSTGANRGAGSIAAISLDQGSSLEATDSTFLLSEWSAIETVSGPVGTKGRLVKLLRCSFRLGRHAPAVALSRTSFDIDSCEFVRNS